MNDSKDFEIEEILQASRFWVQCVLVPITVVIGVAGNTISVMVLTRRRMRSSTNIYLSALAIADIIHLIFVLLLSFKHYSNIHDGKYELYWRFLGIMYWFCDAASSTSVWLTVSFTVERYIAVCHPMKGKVFCTERRAKSIIVIVYIFCTLTTASTTFEYQLNINKTCIERCEPNLMKNQPMNSSFINGTDNHHITNHTIMSNNKKLSNSIVSHPNLDENIENYLTQLKLFILSNCSLQPCIIYVPPLASNASKDNSVIPNIIAKKLSMKAITKVQDKSQESVLEKPPSISDINSTDLNETILLFPNETCCLKYYTLIAHEYTQLGKNDNYTKIIYWYSSIFFWLIPLTLIATFNIFLVRAVYLSQRLRRQMTNSQEITGLTNEKRITIMLIGVIVLFIICHTPTGTILIYNNFHKSKTEREENVEKILGNFFNYLIIVNASCNFLLYSFFSKKFRSTFKQLFFERKKKQDVIMLSSTKSKTSQKFDPKRHGIMRRNASAYVTPRSLETQSLTSIPRSKSLITRPLGWAKSSDLVT